MPTSPDNFIAETGGPAAGRWIFDFWGTAP
jgi:hypothetical protein